MTIEHDPILFTTTELISNTLFRNYGFQIEEGKPTLRYVEEFSRANYKTVNWRCRELYHFQVHRHQDAPEIPDVISSQVRMYITGFITAQL